MTQWALIKEELFLISFVGVLLVHRGLILFIHWICALLILLFDLGSALSCVIYFWGPCVYLSCPVWTPKKKGQLKKYEENCNLNIHKALLSFPSHLYRQEIILFRCGFWQLPLIVTSLCPMSPRCSRVTSHLNVIARSGEDTGATGGGGWHHFAATG